MSMIKIKPRVFGQLYQLSDLYTAKRAIDSVSARSKVPVLIIDDEEFTYINELRNEKFLITTIKDIEDYSAVAEYPVVICDVKGVGHKFNKEKEGAYIVKELKKRYPFKQFAVYSSVSTYKLEIMNDLEGIKRIKKDVDMDMWCSYIDEMIKLASDPIEIWKTIRNFLLSKDVPIKDVMLMESNYVDIYINRPQDMKNFPEENSFPNLKQDVRSIIQSMIAGGLLHILGI